MNSDSYIMATRKSTDRKIISLLIVAAVVQMILLLAHSGVISFGPASDTAEGQRAGVIAESHNHLRRRSLNSLVWEDSGRDEVLHYYDSVLTLKESTARLKLDNNTEVELSENTLITIDPPDESQSGEIRLRFVRGNLAARNAFAGSRIGGDAWTVELKKGSEVELREVGDSGVEVQVKQGDAVVSTASGSETVGANQILRVDGADVSKMDLESSLKWVQTPPKRVYLHDEALPLSLEWRGEASELLIQSLGRPERVLKLAPGVQRGIADLGTGQHRLYLRHGALSSEPLDLQVWRAPVLHLLSPLPRNRVEIGEPVRFVWQRLPEVAKFKLKMNGRDGEKVFELKENSYPHEFAEEEDFQWYVEGVDPEGFVIPPLYRYPLFVREKPFAPPRLRTPEIRKPASESKTPPPKGSSLSQPTSHYVSILFSYFFAPAEATTEIKDGKFEAVFSWEPVDKADQYIIEISETADFRNPIVNSVLPTSEFTWRNFKLQKYHWRVAAGSSKGRMGVFTDPVSVDFEPLAKNAAIAALDGVLIRAIKVLPLAATPPPTVLEKPTDGPSVLPLTKALPHAEAQAPIKRRINLNQNQENWRPILLWQPNYSFMQILGNENVKASLSGGATMAFGFEMPWRDYRNALWVFDGAINYYMFKPDPAERFPFQDDINWLEFDLNATRYTSPLGLGLKVRQMISLRRKSYEEVEADTTLWFGPELTKNYPLSRGEFNIRLSAIFSRDGQAAYIQPEWRARIGERFITGVGAEGLWILKAPSSELILRGFVTIGYPF